jgi:hypothetical protein
VTERQVSRTPGAVWPSGTPEGLRRFLRPRERPGKVCEMCGEPLDERHSHTVDLTSRSLLCTCLSCGLLFTTPGAAGGRYRTVPDRHRRVDDLVLTTAQWDALAIPVGLVFLFRNSAMGRVVALYPSPAGATESELPVDAWDGIVAANPVLADLEDDVEAVLLRRLDGPGGQVDGNGAAGDGRDGGDGGEGTDESQGRSGFACYLVPVDACYTLVGLVRAHWRGLDGGTEARREIVRFFRDLDARCRPVEAGR